jgi:hypothetical protein
MLPLRTHCLRATSTIQQYHSCVRYLQIKSIIQPPKPAPRHRFPILAPAPPPEKQPKSPVRPRAFDTQNAQIAVSHRTYEKDEWVSEFWNGMVPVIGLAIVVWGLMDRWMHSLPTPNDGQFGPMRYARMEGARYWGEYRKEIQPRPGRRHYDRGV